MAKRSRDPEFNENVVEEEVLEGEEAPKKKKQPSKRKLLTNEILEYLKDHQAELSESLSNLVEDLKTLPTRIRGEGKPSIADQIKSIIFAEEHDGKVHEDVFYDTFKAGRLEMRRRFRNMYAKVKNPDDRIFVKAEKQDDESIIYVLIGTGPETPEGFEIKKKED